MQRCQVYLLAYRDLVRTYEGSRSCHAPDVVAASQRLDHLMARCFVRTKARATREDRVATWLCSLVRQPGTADPPSLGQGLAPATLGHAARRATSIDA